MQFYRHRFNQLLHRLTGVELNPLLRLVWLARKSGTISTSHLPYISLSYNDKRALNDILSAHPFLLFSKYEGCQTVWRWLIKHDYYIIIEFILNGGNGEYQVKWQIPVNDYDENDGSTIFTDHTLTLSYDLFKLLVTTAGENFLLYNKITNETVLHMLAKHKSKEEALCILRNIVVSNSMELDPDLQDFAGRTALHYALERGYVKIAELLVERVGASWDLDMGCVSNETLASKHPKCVEFLQTCRERYSIKPNCEGQGDTCVICLAAIETSAYSLQCCKVKLHTDCLRKYLARTVSFTCLICRKDIDDNYLYNSTPNTIFKSKWKMERQAAPNGRGSSSTETEYVSRLLPLLLRLTNDYSFAGSNGGVFYVILD